MREVGGENFGAEKGAEKSPVKGRGCIFGSSSKWFEQPHPKLVHSSRIYLPTHCQVESIMGLHDLLGVGN